MKTKNILIEKRREYKKPTLQELNVKQTKGGDILKNHENKNHHS